MFIDEAKINIKGGDGGNGCVSMHREKYRPHGGPDGGYGGNGGNVILEGKSDMNTLSKFYKKVHFKAERGSHGKGNNKNGKVGKDIIVNVPPGTVVYDDSTARVIGDITRDGQRIIVARGGRGGKGNAHFATSNYRAPSFAEKGEEVEDKWIRLELKLIAHVGLVGLPNAGKSTFLSAISHATPKIASYPFTTIHPNLGVVHATEGIRYVFADIPGIIEGAHEGKGMGHKFLRHISRAGMLIVIIDLTKVNPESPLDVYDTIMNEIELYDQELAKRETIIALNKIDIVGTEEAYFALRDKLEESGKKCYPISALTSEGINELLVAVFEILKGIEKNMPYEEISEKIIIDSETEGINTKSFTIDKVEDYFVVRGKGIERMVQMTDIENDEAVYYLQSRIKRMGLENRLKEMGVKDGDFIVIGGFEFNYTEEKELKKKK
ncbi:MAG: GTPase ObgE [Candidatus Eremiobacteraeota bacterium]|nr:GTPase ObgE [Candidatus Eremiobacteraeota bacterium]